MANLTKIYRHRFDDGDRADMDAVWQVLVTHYFRRWIKPNDAVIDIGAGLCNFINNVSAKRRIAFDADPSVTERAAPGVEVISDTSLIGHGLEGDLDVAFLSNFLEHLENGDAVLSMLNDAYKLLKPGGKILILQPNFSLIGSGYFDFIDHKTILTEKSVHEALELAGYNITFSKKRFLPYTSKSRTPRHPWLVRLYLMMPPAQWLMAGQSFFVGQKPGA